MGKQGDVKLTVSGLAGVTPVGVSITYPLGGIPTAAVDLAPAAPGVLKIAGAPSGILENVDSKKRSEVTVNISVSTYIGQKGSGKTNTLKFVGLLDGLSIGNSVGGSSYQAILKNKAQRLLELTTIMPGLNPASINVYTNPMYGMVYDPSQENNKAMRAWRCIEQNSGVDFNQSPIVVYTEIMKWIVTHQESGWRDFIGENKLADGDYPFTKIFEDPRYQATIKQAKEVLDNVDYSAVNGGSSKGAASVVISQVMAKIGDIFAGGPNTLLESYMNFLAVMGCTIVCGNTKLFVVPVNSVITQDYSAPAYKKLQTRPNTAYPADYSSYSYNDNGYRDIGAVIVSTQNSPGGTYLGGFSFENGSAAHFTAPKDISNASGVLVVNANPFMMLAATAFVPSDANIGRSELDRPGNPMTPGADGLSHEAILKKTKEQQEEAAKKKNQAYSAYISETLKNYAETRFYQERYHDRNGSITLDFNPDWVPGTSGTLFIRQTSMFVAFYVTSVTHRIDMSPPNSGTAITVVNFSCGRMGAKPVGVSEDKYLGYNLAKERAVQDAFIKDNK